MGNPAICSWFFKTIRVTEKVYYLFQFASCFIEQRSILRISNVLRGYRGIANLCSKQCAVPGSGALFLAETKSLWRRVTQQIICVQDKLQVDTFSPFNQQCPCERSRVLKGRQTDEILVIRIYQGTENHPARFCNISCI